MIEVIYGTLPPEQNPATPSDQELIAEILAEQRPWAEVICISRAGKVIWRRGGKVPKGAAS